MYEKKRFQKRKPQLRHNSFDVNFKKTHQVVLTERNRKLESISEDTQKEEGALRTKRNGWSRALSRIYA